jgi:hypothetical protein
VTGERILDGMEPRRPRFPGRGRRRSRDPVPVAPWETPSWPDDEDNGGSAGVREPRHPKPLGPMSAAAEAEPPPPPLVAQLPDPRY